MDVVCAGRYARAVWNGKYEPMTPFREEQVGPEEDVSNPEAGLWVS